MLETSFSPAWFNGLHALLASNTPCARVYDNRVWPNQRLIEAIQADGGGRRILIGTDTAAFNANNLDLIAIAKRWPASVCTIAYENSAEGALSALAAADYFVYKDGGEPEARFFNQFKGALVSRVGRMPGAVAIPFPQPSPDGGAVRLFRLGPANGSPR